MWQAIAIICFLGAIAEAMTGKDDERAYKKMIRFRDEQISAMRADIKFYSKRCEEQAGEIKRLNELLDRCEDDGK